MGNDILSVIFLALICIVIAGILHRITPVGLMMPSFALMAVCLWIAYDYMMLERYKMKSKCEKKSEEDEELETKILILTAEVNDAGAESIVVEDADRPVSLAPEAKCSGEFDIDIYANGASVQDVHKHMGCPADNKLANRMKYMSLQTKLSKDIRTRMNKNTMLPYFEEDLRENENRDWWDAENDWMDELM